MNYKGFYISKLILKGEGKDTVQLKLTKGLNVVSGASDTGKSYIFQCINYVLGSKDKPKAINESEGYNVFILQLTTYEDKSYTLIRKIDQKNIELYKCLYENIENFQATKLLSKFDKKNENNISSFLLRIADIKYTSVLKNQKGDCVSFSFRDLVHFNMLSEHKIISSDSIIYDGGGNTTRPKSKSILRTIITGKDDSDIEKNKVATVNLNSDIYNTQLINKLIECNKIKLKKFDDEMELKCSKYVSLEQINIEVNNIRNQIDIQKQEVDKLEIEQEKLKRDKMKYHNKNIYYSELVKRFCLLKKNYESDLKRLEFIDEAKFYLEELVDVKCPLCNSNISTNMEHGFEDNVNFKEAILAEQKKIYLQLSDLELVIIEAEGKSKKHEEHFIKINNELIDLEDKLNNVYKSRLSDNITNLEELIDIRQYIKIREFILDDIKTLSQQNNNDTEDDIDNEVEGKSKTYIREVDKEILKDICDLAEKILDKYNAFDKVEIKFNEKTMDLIVNNMDKNTFGKGYGALINSAFAIAIMLYTREKKLANVGNIILDSPLTAFKGKDKKQNEDNIREEVKTEFYNALYSIGKDIQIIILDNVEPPKEIQEKITHYHFSGDSSVGRKGFL